MISRYKTEFSEHKAHYISVITLLLLGFGLRLYYLLDTGPEGDEMISYLLFGSRPLSESLTTFSANNHPLNTIFMNLSTGIFGGGLPAIRLGSFICGIAVLPLIYIIIRKLFNKESALLGLALTVSSYALVYYSAIARGYSIQTCIYLLLILTTIHIKETGKGWFWFVALTVLGFYTIVTFIYFMAGVFFWLLVSAWHKDILDGRKKFLGKLALYTTVSAVVTILAYVPYILGSGVSETLGNQFTKSLPVGDFVRLMWDTIMNIWESWSYGLAWVYLLLLLGFVISVVFSKKISKVRVSFPLVTMLALILIFLLQRGTPYPRVFVPYLPVFFGCSAAGIYFVGHSASEQVRNKLNHPARPYVLGLLAVGMAILLTLQVFPSAEIHGAKHFAWQLPGYDYAEITNELREKLQEGDLVVTDKLSTVNLTYSFTRNDIPLEHLLNNLAGTEALSPGEVERMLIITDIGYGNLYGIAMDHRLEFNISLYDCESWFPRDVNKSLYQIIVVPTGDGCDK